MGKREDVLDRAVRAALDEQDMYNIDQFGVSMMSEPGEFPVRRMVERWPTAMLKVREQFNEEVKQQIEFSEVHDADRW